jgi:molecular chaperone HtpG
MEKIKFQIEIDRVLDILSKEIYDSPYALLRENVQNAYDAILMREQYSEGKWSAQKEGIVKVVLGDGKIVVSDNGIGMSERVLKENYWKAGSSGKRTELARKSGVIGTFGIGGMANFGVCSTLKLETESMETKERIISEVERKNLSLSEDCISIKKTTPTSEYGTKITVTLDPQVVLEYERAKEYLSRFVQYLPIRVELNGGVISQNSLEQRYREESPKLQRKWEGFEHAGTKADALVQCDYNAQVSVIVTKISISGEPVDGLACLRQDSGHLWGFRSFFGLAPIPISALYSLGGVVNLSILMPTAGREALSKESVELTARLINLVEECTTRTLSESEMCNRSNPFMSYVLSTGKLTLAGKLQVRVEPDREMTLDQLREYSEKRTVNYYEGTDETLIKSLGTPDKPLVVLSRSYPRRQVEAQFIQAFCKVEKITDMPKVLKVYPENEYTMDEMSFAIWIRSILEDDYALQSAEIKLADITHGVPLLVKSPSPGAVEICIQRHHPTLQPILRCYEVSRDVFPGFVKDFVRVYIYPQIRSWVPSSTKEGADALQEILKKKKELYEIGLSDVGLTSAMSDFLAGKVPFKEVVDKFTALRNSQTQKIEKSAVGKLEAEIPDLVENPIHPPKDTSASTLQPSPAILRNEVTTDKKLLVVDKQSPMLNNFRIFLAVSERAFKEEYFFFTTPHATRIIWGGNRVTFIFTHASSRFSLYYDIELFEDVGGRAGGGIFPTTTIVTKNRIFVPIPDDLKKYFEIPKGKNEKKFYVRYDLL